MNKKEKLKLFATQNRRRIFSELGKGNISEGWIPSEGELKIHGFCAGGKGSDRNITINPVHVMVDTLVHELLHRIHPDWTEKQVRVATAYMCRRFSDRTMQALYRKFKRMAKKGRK